MTSAMAFWVGTAAGGRSTGSRFNAFNSRSFGFIFIPLRCFYPVSLSPRGQGIDLFEVLFKDKDKYFLIKWSGSNFYCGLK
jgi:hypothetical protein